MNDFASMSPLERLDAVESALTERFGSRGCSVVRAYNELTLILPSGGGELIEIATELRDGEPFRFTELIDVCGLDYLAYGKGEWNTTEASGSGFGRGVQKEGLEPMADRFGVAYHLLSIANNTRLRVRVPLDSEEPIVASMVDVWRVAEWFEREAFDLYGIMFDGHPDLRRILTDYGFVGHPFRKDFPLTGHVEMRYDPTQRRVIYEPVTVEQRTQVPRVLRDDNRYQSAE